MSGTHFYDGPEHEVDSPLAGDIYCYAVYTCIVNWDAMWDSELTVMKRVDAVCGFVVGLLLLLLNLFIQVSLMWFTKRYIVIPGNDALEMRRYEFKAKFGGNWTEESMYEALDTHDELAKHFCEIPVSDPKFLYVILFLWTLVMITDLRSSCELIRDIHGLPDREQGKHMIVVNDDQEQKITSTTAFCRLHIWVMVIIPKVVIGIYVLHYGMRWLVHTSGFADLILNSLALAFIVEIDELIFRTMLSQELQDVVTNTSFKYNVRELVCCDACHAIPPWKSHWSVVVLACITFGLVFGYVEFYMPYAYTPLDMPELDELPDIKVVDMEKVQDGLEEGNTKRLLKQGNVVSRAILLKWEDNLCQTLIREWYNPYHEDGRRKTWFARIIDKERLRDQKHEKRRRKAKAKAHRFLQVNYNHPPQ